MCFTSTEGPADQRTPNQDLTLILLIIIYAFLMLCIVSASAFLVVPWTMATTAHPDETLRRLHKCKANTTQDLVVWWAGTCQSRRRLSRVFEQAWGTASLSSVLLLVPGLL